MIVDNLSLGWKGLERTLCEDGPFDLVLLMAGTNDLGAGRTPDQIVENLQCLHAVCHSYGVPTVALAPPPAPGRGPRWEAMRAPIVEALNCLPMEMPGVLACVDPGMLVSASWAPYWDQDGLHFAESGSCALGKELANLARRHFLPHLPNFQGEMEDVDADYMAGWRQQGQQNSLFCSAQAISPYGWVL